MIKRIKKYFEEIKISNCLLSVAGSFILAFALYNIHSKSGVTEGGILGLTLLLDNVFGVSPSVSGLILNVLCYIFGIKILGKKFLVYSAVSALSFSIFYAISEQLPPIFPNIENHPLLACIFGAIFVGLGVGICVLNGGAPTGDDALAMSISKKLKIKIQWVYLITDLTVLLLSLIYIPFSKIVYSLLTVILSGQIIGLIQKIKIKK